MDAEKLVDDIVQVLGDGGWTPNTYVKNKAVALLTRAIEEETQALLCSEQIKHNKIAEICFAVGAETPDGTSTGAVNNLADKYNALLDRERPTPEPAEDAREVVIKAASIANDYIQGLGDQSRNSEILGRGVQKAILESVELDLQARAYRARLLGEAAERAVKYVKGNLITWEPEIMDEHCKEIRAAVRGKE